MTMLPRSLNIRVIVLVSTILSITGVLSGWVNANRQSERLAASMRGHSIVMVRNFADSCARFLVLRDYAEVEAFLLKSAELPDIVRLRVCETDGQIIGDVRLDAGGEPMAEASPGRMAIPVTADPLIVPEGMNLTVWAPIKAGSLLGWIRVDYSMASIRQALIETWTQSLIFAFFWVVCSAASILAVLRPTALAFSKMADFARGLNESKGVQIAVEHGPAEIDELAASLNYASARLYSTEQQQAEDKERIRRREALLNESQRVGQIGSWDWDAGIDVIWWSNEYYRIYGLDSGIPTPNYVEHLKAYTAESAARLDAAVKRSLATGEPYVLDLELADPTVSTRWIAARGEVKRDGSGKITGLRGTAQNITERKRAEEEIRKLNESLEQRVTERTGDLQKKSDELKDSQAALVNIVEDLNEKTAELEAANGKLKDLDRLKSLFIASMSHELRTPLNAIIGFSSIVLNEWTGPLTAEQKENLAAILRSGKHLLALINDVIDVSKIEAGKLEAVPEEFDVCGVVAEATQVFGPDIESKNLALSVQVPRQPIQADRRRLLQCLLNLVSNAVKFTDRGAISLRSAVSPDKRSLELSVEDTGIGIGDDDLRKLFAPFVRLAPALQAVIPGTGLGLYLTRKLVREVLRGDISVKSVLGKGSTFTLIVPLTAEGGANAQSARHRGQ